MSLIRATLEKFQVVNERRKEKTGHRYGARSLYRDTDVRRLMKNRVSPEFLDEYMRSLRELDNVEMLDGKYDKSDLISALSMTNERTGDGTSTYTNGMGQSYDSTSKDTQNLYEYLRKF